MPSALGLGQTPSALSSLITASWEQPPWQCTRTRPFSASRIDSEGSESSWAGQHACHSLPTLLTPLSALNICSSIVHLADTVVGKDVSGPIWSLHFWQRWPLDNECLQIGSFEPERTKHLEISDSTLPGDGGKCHFELPSRRFSLPGNVGSML